MNPRNGCTLVLMALALVVSSCTSYWHELTGDNVRQGVSSSLVDFLYPNGEIPPGHDQQIPHLKLPLRVGVAFVPSSQRSVQGLSEAHKAELLEQTRKAFGDREFIKEILIIPDTYLRSGKGFDSVDQVARLYGLDVMALVSYDQVAHVDDTRASILYWTIVGAYFVEGSKNEVQTFVDTAIFDVNTHKLLFRAPGVNRIEGASTLIGSAEETRKAREKSFTLAMQDMTVNLEKELDLFRERIKQDKTAVVSHREGYQGGVGAFDISLLLVLASLWVFKRHLLGPFRKNGHRL